MFEYNNKTFEAKKWSEIKVGDMIKIYKDESFSSDILFLKSSNDSGLAFVDTMNLDGEVI